MIDQAQASAVWLFAGRYDTAEHSVMKHRNTIFKDDWHNSSAPPESAADGLGPRQAWHDIHCRIEGPACHDVMRNFEERWLRQVSFVNASFISTAPVNLPNQLVSPTAQWHLQGVLAFA
jgi:phosphatidylserine/phosphatidylglycerophosphate/cardiolipin synthase-like enzyme